MVVVDSSSLLADLQSMYFGLIEGQWPRGTGSAFVVIIIIIIIILVVIVMTLIDGNKTLYVDCCVVVVACSVGRDAAYN